MHSNYRDRGLLDAVYRVECTLQIENCCEGGFGEPAHSNQSRHGKGGALKAHDCFVAAGCRAYRPPLPTKWTVEKSQPSRWLFCFPGRAVRAVHCRVAQRS